MPFYAVRVGRKPGVYKTWDECKAMVNNFPKPKFKKFDTPTEAQQFVNGYDLPGSNDKHKPNTNQARPSPHKSTFTHFTPQKSAYSSFSQAKRAPASSSSTSSNDGDVDLQIASCKVEMLEEQLAIAKKQKSLLEKEKKLQQLEMGRGGKQTTKKYTAPRESPYKRPEAASSANWKNNRSTQFIDSTEVRNMHTDATCTEDGADDSSVVVYTDGSCINNGMDEPRAGIGVYWGPNHPNNLSERLSGRQTNNRAEIHATIRAIRQAKEQGIKELTIKTDSQFLIKSMTSWIKNWKRNNWKTASNQPVKNMEDFQELEIALKGIIVNWVHVKGHAGHYGNELADSLAVAGANKPL